MVDMIMSLTGVDHAKAEELLLRYETVEDAVASVFVKQEAPGDKFLPAKPKIDDGLTEEQRALCERGRWLQDKVNAVFSVAHSKIQTQQPPAEAPAGVEASHPAPSTGVEIEVQTTE